MNSNTDNKPKMKRNVILIALLAIVVIVLLLIVAHSRMDSPLTAADHLDLGEKYLLDKDYDKALVEFLFVIDIDPKNPRGYTGAAEAYLGLNEIEKAVAVLQNGLETIPGNVEIKSLLEKLLQSGVDSKTEEPNLAKPPEGEKLISLFETVTVEGVVINSVAEYAAQRKVYEDQYGSVGQSCLFGILFNDVLKVEIDGTEIFLNEAEFNASYMYEEKGIDPAEIYKYSLEELCDIINIPARITGSLLPSFGYTGELSWPYGEDSTPYYYPHGGYNFAAESHELL